MATPIPTTPITVHRERWGNKWFTYIFGQRGTGKSTIANGIYKELTEKGCKVVLIDEPLVDTINYAGYKRRVDGIENVILVNHTAEGMELLA
jgi:adenylylsulfate kinase-like enzyme